MRNPGNGPIGDHYVVAGFNVYRTEGVGDLLDDVQVATCYEGLVIEGAAKVVQAGEGRVVMAVAPDQARALAHTKLAFVESPLHGCGYRARVHCASPPTGEIELTDFEPFNEVVARRKQPRVLPVHAMLMRLTKADDEVCGRVIDVSPEALGAIVDRDAINRFGQTDGEAQVDVWGEYAKIDGLEDFRTSAFLIRLTELEPANAQLCKVVIGLSVFPALERALNRYTARRQRETLVALEWQQPRSNLGIDEKIVNLSSN